MRHPIEKLWANLALHEQLLREKPDDPKAPQWRAQITWLTRRIGAA